MNRTKRDIKYKIIMYFPDREKLELDEIFDTKNEAEYNAQYYCGCKRLGAEILTISNLGRIEI